ncbi:MAG: hypothetical protein JNL96_19240 [Planctomycetaceae bacterium]|nr:hypothetical protein [Planctomycetaceae bacterium]
MKVRFALGEFVEAASMPYLRCSALIVVSSQLYLPFGFAAIEFLLLLSQVQRETTRLISQQLPVVDVADFSNIAASGERFAVNARRFGCCTFGRRLVARQMRRDEILGGVDARCADRFLL